MTAKPRMLKTLKKPIILETDKIIKTTTIRIIIITHKAETLRAALRALIRLIRPNL